MHGPLEVLNEGGGPHDEAGLGERGGESHQAAHPEHGVPGAFFGDDVLPGEHLGDGRDEDGEELPDCRGKPRGNRTEPDDDSKPKDDGPFLECGFVHDVYLLVGLLNIPPRCFGPEVGGGLTE